MIDREKLGISEWMEKADDKYTRALELKDFKEPGCVTLLNHDKEYILLRKEHLEAIFGYKF